MNSLKLCVIPVLMHNMLERRVVLFKMNSKVYYMFSKAKIREESGALHMEAAIWFSPVENSTLWVLLLGDKDTQCWNPEEPFGLASY